ncbi:MAG: HEPN domain-containing protein [Candidatus Bathyarchaeia archaeon]
MPVSRKALDWLEMAEDEFKDCERDYRDGSYPSAVYHAEQCAQKAIKAVIVALGFDPGKTHKPTIVLKSLIAGGLVDLKKDYMDLLNKAISYSITLEDQGTLPRYGWETVDRIIKPSEIYDEEKTALLINNAKAVLEIVKKLIGGMDC